MKRQYVYGIALAILAVIVLISGCTSGQAGGPPATDMPPMDMPMGTSMPAASPVPASGEGIAPASLFDAGGFSWYQYKISSGAMGMPMTHTYRYENVTYRGQPARHVNITMDMLPDLLVFADIWRDAADGSTINVHETAFANGRQTVNADVDAANYTKWEGADLASPEFATAPLQPSSTELVTTEAGKYMATRYAGAAGGQQYTYWVSQGVPVPVKLLVHDANGDTSYELSGWG
jgi:hypothetical protein